MSGLFRFANAAPCDPGVEAWFSAPGHELRLTVQPWFEQMRRCGPDIRELLQDGCPTACVGDAAFGYVNAFNSHASVGFFCGADLADPAHLLEGAGKRMRHVKLRWSHKIDAEALSNLIVAAYRDMRSRLGSTLS